MQEISLDINPRRLKSFVRHICVVAKKKRDREDAHVKLKKHIQKLKGISKKRKLKLESEIEELNNKIALVLEKEKELLGKRQQKDISSERLVSGVMENRDRIGNMNKTLKNIEDSIKKYIEVKTERKRKVEELEKKIRVSAKSKKDVSLLKNKLNGLEEMYNRLKGKGYDLSKIKDKIDVLKLKLM